jgi:hypothetical protein
MVTESLALGGRVFWRSWEELSVEGGRRRRNAPNRPGSRPTHKFLAETSPQAIKQCRIASGRHKQCCEGHEMGKTIATKRR